MKICSEIGNITPSCVYRWLNEVEDFRKNYTRAKEDQADYLAEEIIEIADNGFHDVLYTDEYGNKVENKEFVSRSKLKVDARKWVAGKLKPKKYGEKLDVTSDGKQLQPTEIIIKGEKFADKARQ